MECMIGIEPELRRSLETGVKLPREERNEKGAVFLGEGEVSENNIVKIANGILVVSGIQRGINHYCFHFYFWKTILIIVIVFNTYS